MFTDILFTILFSVSPLGEARVGIPYGILNGVPPVLAFLAGLAANLMVFPIMHTIVKAFDQRMWKYSLYKKQSVRLSRRAKNIVGSSIEKYGFWGLMIFVMIPLPVTGAYMGSIAAILFKIPAKRAFTAISLGVIVSCLIVTLGAYFGNKGIQLI
ncbi:small multi-drug export protein [Fulvivirga kasyanovii]|uniref:Ligand-binding protein SH3 n=1 Tax=Fulvivirga kasyanovii TaxID=396812 RepID=A0ABW9RTM7_9BACT|nr:small multi-drug export protein [Fulvivirga kasyanovii]MTI26643.1 ligand-binding protein SH3 [Fulvivirga kasyanovii]